ncbi:MAG: hypothetical protein ABJF89_10790 [Parasphingorhabdus sp.]|uniref:hypothetical protein n=1 Tax=Parasphingorhabdus sp. TaxID=2709688 RepID=UPI003264FC65
MKNIQIMDGARNATFSIFQATDEEFLAIFPDDHDMEIIEDVVERLGEANATQVLSPLWNRPILKSKALGIHGTLFYDYAERRDVIPETRKEVDWDTLSINGAQRQLFVSNR